MNMKTIKKMLLIIVFFCGIYQYVEGQERHEKFEVSTQLSELHGKYAQRKVYRTFLTIYMRDCPYISHFSIEEVKDTQDNHKVIWHYEVKKREDITKFYGWLYNFLESSKANGIKRALAAYAPKYDLSDKTKINKNI